MKNKDGNIEEYGDVFTNENHSVSQAAEIKETTQRSNKKVKKEKFNVPLSKKQSNFNINISLNDNNTKNNQNNSNNLNNINLDNQNIIKPLPMNIQVPIPSPKVEDNKSLIEYKQLKSEYKMMKQELIANPNDEAKIKYKKKLKKRIKQLMTELQI